MGEIEIVIRHKAGDHEAAILTLFTIIPIFSNKILAELSNEMLVD